MKKYFELKIKPLNDRLGANLGIKKIAVTYIPTERVVEVA